MKFGNIFSYLKLKPKKLNYVKGDLIRDRKDFDIIIHGCNCFCMMGAGIAAQVARVIPEAYEVDKKTEKGDGSKLGGYSAVLVDDVTIINAYTQYHGGANYDYSAIRSAMRKIAEDFDKGQIVGLPKIGAGIAGGDWNVIESIIAEELKDFDVTVVIWEGDKKEIANHQKDF